MMSTFDDLHDAHLLALIADGEGRFTLRFKTDTAEVCDVILEKVLRLRCMDFREGNIVLSASIASEVNVKESDLRWILGVSNGDEAAYIRELQAQIAIGELSFFEIVPSFGAEVRAIVGSAGRNAGIVANCR